ncbi:hypothetical protein C0Q70_06650 [Pomacea canaliculata]|uniref:Sulfotransferase domain-containing protein n=1 Tax=Pomacea canaliculata TaxID=400727 RepID=A0A2T7PCV0_POMCA|nr:hypothetical protein C0Q70_06650 [Pomacea canaliculata]
MTQVRVADGAGQSLRFLEVRGFMYPDFPIESIRGVPQLAIHADDVIICAYPKSVDYGSWFEYYASWYQGLRENPDLKVLQLTYEDMKQDSCGGIKKLATFLDINCCSETLRLIDHVCSFDSMRQTKGHMEVDTAGQPIMYRKGNVGDWQEWFTVSQAETFARVYRQNISRWNLTASPAAQYIASVDHQ